MNIFLNCKNCDKPFEIKKYRINTAKYCSKRCGALYVRIIAKTICLICKNEFEHISSRSNKAKYCSKKCYYKAQHLNGSVTFECKHCHKKFLGSPSEKRIYCSRACINKESKKTFVAKYTTVRKKMIIRDMVKKCEICGYNESKEILGIHHKDRNNKNNELSNLMVLCPNCHSLEHRKHISH